MRRLDPLTRDLIGCALLSAFVIIFGTLVIIGIATLVEIAMGG